jgi:tripartite-type tricarboxylate transporter receptor subunit TctC
MKRVVFIIAASLLASALIVGPVSVHAQSYPDRPIQLIIPVAPGVVLDITGRLVAEELTKILKTQVVVINKPGASMVLGTDQVARSKRDGYTIGYANTSAIVFSRVTNPETVPYDPMKDLEPLGLHLFFPLTVTVQASSPWKTFNELIEYAKKNPGKLRVSTPGEATIDNFNLVITQTLTGAQFTHVPFKGGQSVTALLGGTVEVTYYSLSQVLPYLESGQLRTLLSTNKLPRFPDIPTIRDLGYKQDLFSAWVGFYAPAGLPGDVKKILIPAIEKAVNALEPKEKINKMGFVVDYRPPEELRKLSVEDYDRAYVVAKKLGIAK